MSKLTITVTPTEHLKIRLIEWLCDNFESKYSVPFYKHEEYEKQEIVSEILESIVNNFAESSFFDLKVKYQTKDYEHFYFNTVIGSTNQDFEFEIDQTGELITQTKPY